MSVAKYTWPRNTVEGRWCSFGPYYAMFPVGFTRQVIEQYSEAGNAVLDPFCGRGTVPFVSQALKRHSVGIELNPVGWLFSTVKTDPYPRVAQLIDRLAEIDNRMEKSDLVAENEFQAWAWAPRVLGFLNAARRHLDWRYSHLDRTVMGFILVHLHSKLGEGLSNQMRQSKAMAPDYSVRWWQAKGMKPPDIDPVECLSDKIHRRYTYGVPEESSSKIFLRDARIALDELKGSKFDLILTSPPYRGVTNYRYDNWIRLWMLGGPSLPEGGIRERYVDKKRYGNLIDKVFKKTAQLTDRNSIIYVRTDARQFTYSVTMTTLLKYFPQHFTAIRHEHAKSSQTPLFGDKSSKPGEIDILLLPRPRVKSPSGFRKLGNEGRKLAKAALS